MSKQTIPQWQSECDHKGSWKNGGQVATPSINGKVMVLINTLFCGKCGSMMFNLEEIKLPDSLGGPKITPIRGTLKN